MKNTLGHHISVTLFGESHGEAVGAVLDGLCPGIPLDRGIIEEKLNMRRPVGKISTARREPDDFRILSGVFEGKTTGTPLTILIPNTNTHSGDYEATRFLARPGHADYTAQMKYHGFQDYRGGGHFSGRITAALVAAGAVAAMALTRCGIAVGTHVARLAGVDDRPFSDHAKDIATLNGRLFGVLDEAKGEEMRNAITRAAAEGDSVGGILETAVVGMPAGVGEPWFDTVEGMLAHALFSIPAVKGVEFGDGFALADRRGHEANDAFATDGKKIVTRTNHNGGINGGITNGMPLIVRTAVKPTPSIFLPQETVDLSRMTNETLSLKGRHDPAVVHRARAVADAVTALVLADLLAGRYGTDVFMTEGAWEDRL